MVSFENITLEIGKQKIFSEISVNFDNGEIIGITGRAGSGKNSFVNLLRDRKIHYSGKISIDNKNIRDFTTREFPFLISHYASFNRVYNPESTIYDWILGGRIHHKKFLNPYSENDKEIVYKEMANFNLNQEKDLRLKSVSDSKRSIASLARTFASGSRIVLLEKPEAGLDIRQRNLLVNSLKKHSSSGNNVIIVTSSDLNLLAASCDRIILLADEKIARIGNHQIITADFIKKYFNVEAVVSKNIFSGLPEVQIIE